MASALRSIYYGTEYECMLQLSTLLLWHSFWHNHWVGMLPSAGYSKNTLFGVISAIVL